MGKPIKLRTVRRPVCVSCICRGQASQPSQWRQHEVGGEILRTIHMMPGPCYNEKKAQHMKSKPRVDSTGLPAEHAPTLLQAGFVL